MLNKREDQLTIPGEVEGLKRNFGAFHSQVLNASNSHAKGRRQAEHTTPELTLGSRSFDLLYFIESRRKIILINKFSI